MEQLEQPIHFIESKSFKEDSIDLLLCCLDALEYIYESKEVFSF